MSNPRLGRILALTAGVLFVSPAFAAAEDIQSQYIVVMKQGSTATDTAQSQRQARREGGRVQQEFSSAIDGYSAELDPAALDAVREDPDVSYVEPNQVISVQTQQTNAPWGLDRIDQRALPLNKVYDPGTRAGKGVTAYVLDTGVRRTQTEFGGRVTFGTNTVDAVTTDDCNGHGTHVAGLLGGSMYGVAKAVRIVSVKVLGCAGSGTTMSVIAGLNWMIGAHLAGQPAVANLSLGGAKSEALNDEIQAAIADGITVVVAAGNNNADACNSSPASAVNAITVSATDSTDAKATYSNWGQCVDLYAPGTNILSAWNTSDTATNTLSGTSMAAPPVAGVAALLLEGNPTALPAAVRNAIVIGATKNVVRNGAIGGTPNLLLFSGATL